MQCLTPFSLKERDKITGDIITVPCGKCPNCVKSKGSAWSFRLMQEEKRAMSSHFITLTYDTKFLPYSKSGLMTLAKRDVQLFVKRLRKSLGTWEEFPLKYYAVGEYGTKKIRPHYHFIMFNADINSIEQAWMLGQIHYGEVTGASIGYCLKYLMKKGQVPSGPNDDREPEFAVMSKGIGSNYLSKEMVEWHLRDLDNRMYVNIEGGKKASMSRYYKERLFHDYNFENAEQAKELRKKAMYWARTRMMQERIRMAVEGVMKTKSWEEYDHNNVERDLNEWRKMADESNNNLKL